jgi:hypothetical protein
MGEKEGRVKCCVVVRVRLLSSPQKKRAAPWRRWRTFSSGANEGNGVEDVMLASPTVCDRGSIMPPRGGVDDSKVKISALSTGVAPGAATVSVGLKVKTET